MSWTEERVTLLRKLWGEGKTAAEIAGQLGGVTRNAVIGKAHRLKLSNRISPIQQNVKAVRPVAEPRLPRLARPLAAPSAPFEIKAVKMIELREKMCRWPVGDPRDEDFVFCGHDHLAGFPYCKEHTRMAYQAARSNRGVQVPDDNQVHAADEDAKESAAG